MSRRLGQGGAVTAELALALPAFVIVVALGMAWLGAASRQVRLQDAASAAARLIARGDAESKARAVLADAAPGAGMSVTPRGDLVCVTATADARVALPVRLEAVACALGGVR